MAEAENEELDRQEDAEREERQGDDKGSDGVQERGKGKKGSPQILEERDCVLF